MAYDPKQGYVITAPLHAGISVDNDGNPTEIVTASGGVAALSKASITSDPATGAPTIVTKTSEGVEVKTLVSGDGPWSMVRRALPLQKMISGFGSGTTFSDGVDPFPVLPWVASTVYATGSVRSNLGRIYVADIGGTSASTGGPSTTLSIIADGTVTWRHLRTDPDAWKINTVYPYGKLVTNVGQMYACTVPGTSASSGSGPTANNTSIVDNTCTWTRIQQQWVDSVAGNDANSGSSPSAAKRSIPTSLVSNFHYWINAGAKLEIDFSTTPTGNGISANSVFTSMTVYDRATFNEICDQPNPFLLALEGRWVTQDDIDSKYFHVIANGYAVNASVITGTSGKGITGTASASRVKIRGIYLKGWPYGGIVAQTGGAWDVSDFLIESCKQDTAGTTEAGGCGIRLEGPSSNGSHKLRRFAIRDSGTDAFWASAAVPATNWSLNDFAIHHKPTATYSGNHCDAFQFGMGAGNFQILRGVVEHDASLINYTDGTPANAQAIIQDASSAAGTEAWQIRDLLVVSNSLCTNFQRASTAEGFNRSIFVYLDEGSGRKNAFLHNGNVAWTLTNCVNAVEGSALRPLIYSGVVPTLVSCSEVTI